VKDSLNRKRAFKTSTKRRQRESAKSSVSGQLLTTGKLGRPPRFTMFVNKETPTAAKIKLIRSGLHARMVDDMVAYLDVPKNVIFRVLHTPESTAHRLIRDNRALDSAASERVVRVADITRIAEATFGGRNPARRWLQSPNLALGDVTPLSMLDTEPGASEVRRILSSINYGGAF
jgi:putative toxin-antitoxin system antitoxin component (TIGR02293 family)